MASDDAMSDAASDSSSSSSAASFHIEHELPYLTPPSSLLNFWRLPRELQHRIISLACPPTMSSRNTIIGRSSDDTTTILRLIQTSRFFYAQATPLLYAHVRVTRPSVLLAFQRTLAARPALGQVVKSLHIGADEVLPRDWWPMRDSDSSFRLNLGGSSEEHGAWLGSPSYEYYMDCDEACHFHEDPSKDPALQQALEVGTKELNIQLELEGRDHARNVIDKNVWYMRVLEVQAALELYYLELQGRDEKEARRPAKRVKGGSTKESTPREAGAVYPKLQLSTDAIKERGRKSSDVFHVTSAQIFQRMTSAGAPTDRFNHPILSARSRVEWMAAASDGRVYSVETGMRDAADTEETVDPFSALHLSIVPAHGQESENAQAPSPSDWDPLSLATPSSATVDGCLALARSIFSLTPHVRNLSLAGFFERVLAGQRPSCHQDVQSVTLGPATPAWDLALRLHHTALDDIKRLRVCGSALAEIELADLVGVDGALPELSTVRWSMASKYDPQKPPHRAIANIRQLFGLDNDTNSDHSWCLDISEWTRTRSRVGSNDDNDSTSRHNVDQDEDSQSDTGPRSTYFEAYFHPNDVSAILAAAPNEEMAKAWKEGSVVPGVRHRLKVCEHPAYSKSESFAWANDSAIKALYDEGRTWWEDGCVGGVAD